MSGKTIEFQNIDVAESYARLLRLIQEFRPHAIIHFGEQRAAPYSMKSSYHKRYTVSNNLNATNNILAAIVEAGVDSHLIHLGTMGVYGYGTAGMKIPEGYLPVKIETDDGREIRQEILYPANPGSIYHMTKTQDQLLLRSTTRTTASRSPTCTRASSGGTQTEVNADGRPADQPVRL